MRRAFSGLSCLSRGFICAPLLGSPALCGSLRLVASYPTPGGAYGSRRASRKKFNFLNSGRLVESERETRDRRKIRLRDDVFFHQRLQYRETVSKCIEKEIRYFPENVKRYVFFKNRVDVVTNAFHGMRKAPGWLSRRILQHVEDEILKLENRKHLVELIESAGVVPPTEEEWARYTDEKTGQPIINLYYHGSVERHLRSFCTEKFCSKSFRLLQAFLILNRNNFNVCPPLRTWSLRQGPVRDEELVERGSQKEVRDIIEELCEYQSSCFMREFNKLSMKEKEDLVKQAEENKESLQREYERERVFGARVMCGITNLKEVRSMTTPAISYYNEEFYKYIIKRGGSAEVTLRQSKEVIPSWFTLPKETRLKYYCFEKSVEMHPVSGAHLYLRYCSRDYGLPREEAMEKWYNLSELQKAALGFCFYSPISTPRRSSSSFRRFYFKQCKLHGLVMTGKACGNKAFLRRVRGMWMRMSADERAAYEETESFSSVFPLQPTSLSASKELPATSNHPRHNHHAAVSASGSPSTEKTSRALLQASRASDVANKTNGDDDYEEGDHNDGMLYFGDEIISDDSVHKEEVTYETKTVSHTELRQPEKKHVLFTI